MFPSCPFEPGSSTPAFGLRWNRVFHPFLWSFHVELSEDKHCLGNPNHFSLCQLAGVAREQFCQVPCYLVACQVRLVDFAAAVAWLFQPLKRIPRAVCVSAVRKPRRVLLCFFESEPGVSVDFKGNQKENQSFRAQLTVQPQDSTHTQTQAGNAMR